MPLKDHTTGDLVERISLVVDVATEPGNVLPALASLLLHLEEQEEKSRGRPDSLDSSAVIEKGNSLKTQTEAVGPSNPRD